MPRKQNILHVKTNNMCNFYLCRNIRRHEVVVLSARIMLHKRLNGSDLLVPLLVEKAYFKEACLFGEYKFQTLGFFGEKDFS